MLQLVLAGLVVALTSVVWCGLYGGEGGTWATAEELGSGEPHIGSEAGNGTFWHRHFGIGTQASQSVLVQWEIENDQPVRFWQTETAKHQHPGILGYS